MPAKPFSQASENNKAPILSVLKNLFPGPTEILEIGSGTGQHAAHFCQRLPHVQWQPSDLAIHLDGIRLWREEANLNNFKPPVELDATSRQWPIESTDCIYTANTCHIMGWKEVQLFLARAGAVIRSQGYLCIYGPFNYPKTQNPNLIGDDGNEKCDYTSESNARFDQWLKQRDPKSGIRDITAMNFQARKAGLVPFQDNEMPANNRLVVWQRE